MRSLKAIGLTIVISIILITAITITTINTQEKITPTKATTTRTSSSTVPLIPLTGYEKTTIPVKRIESTDELKNLIEEAKLSYKTYSEILGLGSLMFRAMVLESKGAVPVPVTATVPTPQLAKAVTGGEATAIKYSKTNVQVQGVDEPDIVKTDGEYIYLASKDKLYIVKAYDPHEAKIVHVLELNDSYINGVFINDDRLIIIATPTTVGAKLYVKTATIPTVPVVTPMPMRVIAPIPQNTTVYVYDISDRANPKQLLNITVTGRYVTARMLGKYVYIIINAPLIENKGYIYLPAINGKPVDPREIMYFEKDYNYAFTIILAIDLETLENSKNIFLLGTSSHVYMSIRNLYILSRKWIEVSELADKYIDIIKEILPEDVKIKVINIWNDKELRLRRKIMEITETLSDWFNKLPRSDKEKYMIKIMNAYRTIAITRPSENTVIYRFSLDGLNVTARAKGSVPGRVLDQFSMDEYGEYFRIATTSNTVKDGRIVTVNNVYVLDMNLTIVGKLEGLAPGERIYAARYLGNVMYLVTFRRIDPLYGIDLSDPKNPRVLGYLKIPGFSEYLHPYKDKYLIGIGREATETGRIKGIKIALFDISNITNIKELSGIEIGSPRTWSPILRDHKAFMINTKEGYFAVPVQGDINGVYIIDITDKGELKIRGLIPHHHPLRTIYIGEYIYTISTEVIKIVDKDLKLVKEVKLTT